MASTRIYRTSGTPTNRKKFTISCWLKKSKLADDMQIVNFYEDANNRTQFSFNSSDQFDFIVKSGNTNTMRLKTTRKFRDPSAWYHIVMTVDTTQATNTDRLKVYINGEQNLSANNGFASETYPSQNADATVGGTHNIGAYDNGGSPALYWDGLLAHLHYTDGYAYAASDFGETDSTSGIWKPKTAPSVTYGTNGFFLKFENSGNLDLDSSGNNLSFTTSGTLTQNVDTPSNNFATLNPLQTNLTLTNGNTSATTTDYKYGLSTLAINSGKYYFEMKVTHACMVMGIQDMIKANDRLLVNNVFWFSGSQSYHLDGFSRFSHDSYGDISTSATDYPTYTNGDIVMMAVDLENNKLAYGKNGTWYNSTNPGSGTTNMVSIDAPSTLDSGFYGIVAGDTCGASDGTFNINFGQGYFGTTQVASAGTAPSEGGIFEYDCPSGYQALCTKGINSF